MSTLIILRGNSGSGKTTLAKALQEHFGSNTMRLSHDMIRMDILHTWSREGVEKSLPLMQELLKYGRRNSEITVMEGVLPSDAYRPLFETALEEFGDRIFAYYYDIPFEETLRRHQTKP
ncbi:MAG: kinase, partial [Clostridia bacterium]|nr:kinase [Clostridia bacterium]